MGLSHRGARVAWASKSGYWSVVRYLLDIGKVDVNSKDSCGRTPLHIAGFREWASIVKLLVDTGKVNVNINSWIGTTITNSLPKWTFALLLLVFLKSDTRKHCSLSGTASTVESSYLLYVYILLMSLAIQNFIRI
jgi:ankyrin repeat protein